MDQQLQPYKSLKNSSPNKTPTSNLNSNFNGAKGANGGTDGNLLTNIPMPPQMPGKGLIPHNLMQDLVKTKVSVNRGPVLSPTNGLGPNKTNTRDSKDQTSTSIKKGPRDILISNLFGIYAIERISFVGYLPRTILRNYVPISLSRYNHFLEDNLVDLEDPHSLQTGEMLLRKLLKHENLAIFSAPNEGLMDTCQMMALKPKHVCTKGCSDAFYPKSLLKKNMFKLNRAFGEAMKTLMHNSPLTDFTLPTIGMEAADGGGYATKSDIAELKAILINHNLMSSANVAHLGNSIDKNTEGTGNMVRSLAVYYPKSKNYQSCRSYLKTAVGRVKFLQGKRNLVTILGSVHNDLNEEEKLENSQIRSSTSNDSGYGSSSRPFYPLKSSARSEKDKQANRDQMIFHNTANFVQGQTAQASTADYAPQPNLIQHAHMIQPYAYPVNTIYPTQARQDPIQNSNTHDKTNSSKTSANKRQNNDQTHHQNNQKTLRRE